MTDDSKPQSPLGRIMLACGFSEIVMVRKPPSTAMAAPDESAFSAPYFMADYVARTSLVPRLDQFRGTYADYCKAQDRAALEQKLVGLGELNRARMAARLARETSLDRDRACSTAAALHQIGKDVDWFVKMIPTIGTHTASRAVIGMAHYNARAFAFERARSQALVVSAVLHGFIDVSDDRLEIELPPDGGEFAGMFDSAPCIEYSKPRGSIFCRGTIAPEPDEPRQPSYLRHDPTKRHKRRRRR